MKLTRLIFFVIGTASLQAASSGGPYTITSDGLSAAGERTSAGPYQDDTSTGATGAESTSSENYDGASGQSSTLRDAIGLIPGPLKIPEGSLTQLGLFQLLDDSTLLSASSLGASWAKISGPLTLTTGGAATAENVFADQTAQVQLTLLNSTVVSGSITIEDTIADNFGIYGGDGIGDDWQVQFFGQGNALAAPTLDPDGDGQSNLFEFIAGLVPTSGTSRFTVELEDVPGQPGQKRLAFQPANIGRTFTLLKSTTLAPGSWQPVPGATISGNNGSLMLTDPLGTGARAFYQVRIDVP